MVEQADLDLVLLNWGVHWPSAVSGWVNDQPTDGMIDQDDLDGVFLHWGNTSVSDRVVPEPTSVMLALVGVGRASYKVDEWHVEPRDSSRTVRVDHALTSCLLIRT